MPKLPKLHDFPVNEMGLIRGSELEAIHPAVDQLGMKVGDKIYLGFDGEYVCYSGFTWDIEQIQFEIEHGIWKATGEVLDPSTPEGNIVFAIFVKDADYVNV